MSDFMNEIERELATEPDNRIYRTATKEGAALDRIAAATVPALEANTPATLATLADCERALKRIASRGAPLPEEYERMEIVQANGPTVEMSARLLAENGYMTRGPQPLEITMEIYESIGGALVAVSASTLPGEQGREDCRVTVVEPSEDVQAMRFAIMDALEWRDRARSMARKLGWSLKVEVE